MAARFRARLLDGRIASYAAVTLVVAAGVGALVAGSPSVLTALTLVGGAYLIRHGATTFARPSTPDPQATPGTRTRQRSGWAHSTASFASYSLPPGK